MESLDRIFLESLQARYSDFKVFTIRQGVSDGSFALVGRSGFKICYLPAPFFRIRLSCVGVIPR